ncbi:MAG: hypothetical protein COS85_15075 [Armatimonadetes bacterium CG07_land_8_20_14_0_80_59_28]|nr:MAG: hypothetical protein COS85_15075 [Armatimonadetes bacterium CG07_land_8_20_14_0_80_59_28]PIY38524.1 MAG: hypothetical protein COZ05_20710 [Armatimonadetes bacterium CG_4_10_14_3_um_filter_59_10]
MSDTERRYVLEDELARLIGIRGAAEMLLPDVVNNMTLEDLDALIAEGRAAQATDVKEDTEAGTVGTTTSLALDDLQETTIEIRNIGMKQFKRKNLALYKQFKAIPVEAFTDQAILAQAVIADAAWGMVPNPATYEPKPGLTRTAYQAQIADGQTRIGAEAKEVAVPLTRLLSSLTSYMILCRMASRL